MTSVFRSTAYRIALVYSIAFALVMVLLGALGWYTLHQALVRQLDASIAGEVGELVAEYRDEGMPGLREAIAEREIAGISNSMGYAVFDVAGKRVAGHLDTPMPHIGATHIVFKDPREGSDPALARVRSLGDGLRLVVAADLEPIESIDDTMLSISMGALAAVLLIGIGGALLLGGYLRARLGRISGAARAIMAGDLRRRITVSGRHDEIDDLALTLNDMLDRIGDLLENLQQVSTDIAHDLRRPLSRLSTRLERALSDDIDARGMRQAIKDARESTDELLVMFSAILRISEIESRELQNVFKTFDLSDLVTEVCQSYGPAFEDEDRSLAWDIEDALTVNGDRELMAQALVNLLENAMKHTPADTRVQVSLSATAAGKVSLVVADTGPGVADSDRDRIAGRFVRLETARNTPGNGLGLNLVAAIVSLHDGDLAFEDNEPGLRVVIHMASTE